MEKTILDFCNRLSGKHSPAFLFLGQNYLRLDSGKDSFLESILRKYDQLDKSLSGKSYREIFATSLKQDPESARAWIAECANKLVVPPWLEVASQFLWSGVVTSSFDGLLNRAFRSEARTVQPLYSQRLQPLDPRNRGKLHISYLYGGIERDEESQKSPLDEFALIQRAPEAISLVNRLPEQITPAGTLVIEGYDLDDWLTPELLYPVLMRLDVEQAYLFNAGKELLENPYIARAIKEKRLLVFQESLVSVIRQGSDAGVIALGQSPEQEKHGKRLSLGSAVFHVPDHIWASVSRFSTILDDSFFVPPPSLSAEKRYALFRNFLADSGTQPVWSAYGQGLPFERDFEQGLSDRVLKLLRTTSFDADPVVIHGQTGSGKTVALGGLAFKIRDLKQHPVIFIERRTQRFNYADLDTFCKWAEDEGFPATLIVWDGMQEFEQYFTVHKYLVGRGRNFVLVGSCYRLEAGESRGANFIEAPAKLSAGEIARFKILLASLEKTLGTQFDNLLERADNSFLVALYRLLPETRSQVRAGLHLEASAAEIALKERAGQLPPESESTTILADALRRAGFFVNATLLPQEQRPVAGEMVSAEQELVGLVMVPGRFGLQVPVELLVRTMGSLRSKGFHELFSGIDLFRWSEDAQNNIFVGSRQPLEAKLIAQSRLGGPGSEIEYAKKLLAHVKSGDGVFETNEIQFAADLVRNLGPNGPERKQYFRYYLDLVGVLTTLREEAGLVNPRLMLQEASLLREAVVSSLIPDDDIQKRLELLEKAEHILVDAFAHIAVGQRFARMKSMLQVELASTLGTRTREYIRAQYPADQILSEFKKAKAAAMHARVFQPEDFFPIDVIAWSTKDLLTTSTLDSQTRYEIIVDLFNTFEMCAGDEISVRDREKFERRRVEFGFLLRDDTLREDALNNLIAAGSRAGYYLTAVNLASELPISEGEVSHTQVQKSALAATYLESHFDQIKDDGRCINLLLRYWWSANTGLPSFPKERSVVPLTLEQWRHALHLIEELLALDEQFRSPVVIYLQAIAKWHLGYFDDANRIWEELQRISDNVTGRRRVKKTYLASSPDGSPTKFSGTVTQISPDGTRGRIFVEGLRQRVGFFPRDFGLTEVRVDEVIPRFHIAFNFIGPSADPEHHYQSRSRS